MRYAKFYLMLAALSMATGAMAKSEKRGVSENEFSMGSMLEALEPGVSWYYNWANTPGKGYQDQVINFEGIEFVPMCWNANYNADAIRDYCKTHPSTKYLLGFNEPNFTSQANMTPQQAAQEWPKVKALADELGLKLVAPALNYSPNPPYTDPLKWMDEFVALVGLDAFDYTAVHNYGGLGVMKTIAGNFHDRYGKDVWVTEFCYWPGEQAGVYVSPSAQIESMTESLNWLESTPWIYRYAWFKAKGNYNASSGPNYGLLAHEGSSSDPWFLTEQGKVYVGMGSLDREVWHPTGVTVPAVDYVSSNFITLGSTNDAECGSIIEINRFNGGAEATWQFSIPEAGEYIITLSVGGYGEPTRFDPQIQWVIADGDNETPLTDVLKPALPNNDTDYEKITSVVTLPAGHLQLRLKDKAQYQTSGIHISSLRVDDAAGVDEVSEGQFRDNSDIYNLQGIRVGSGLSDWEKLPRGLYIKDGKLIKK